MQRADAQTLMEQATMTAERYLVMAIGCIDGQFGEGYAEKNPALVAAFMQTAASDFQTGFIGFKIEDLADAISAVAESAYQRAMAAE